MPLEVLVFISEQLKFAAYSGGDMYFGMTVAMPAGLEA